MRTIVSVSQSAIDFFALTSSSRLDLIAKNAICTSSMTMREYNQPEEDPPDWVHPRAHMVLLGEAAHPFPVSDFTRPPLTDNEVDLRSCSARLDSN